MDDNVYEISGRVAKVLVLSAAVADTGVLEKGQYALWSDVDCRAAVERQTPSPVLSMTNGFPVFGATKQLVRLRVGEGQRIYAIAGGAGTLNYQRVGN